MSQAVASSMSVAFEGSVVPFPRRATSRQAETAALLEAVASGGSLEIVPRAFAARNAAAALHLMGFIAIDEVLPEGGTRRLSPAQARTASPFLTWMVSHIRGR
jgi:hypothetical protein